MPIGRGLMSRLVRLFLWPILVVTISPARAGGEFSLGDAITEALRGSVSVLIRQQQVVAAEGRVLQAKGAFDHVIGASVGRQRDMRPLRKDEMAAYPASGIDPIDAQRLQTTSYRIGADRTLMNGVSAGAGFGVSAATDKLLGATGLPPQLVGSLTFILKVPLARNAGRETVGAELDAAQAEAEAVRAELHHGNAQLVLDTTLAYWTWVARSKRLAIAIAGERRISELVDEMRKLIDAGELPRGDIELALASRAEKVAQRLAAEQSLDEARRTVARLLSLPATRVAEIGLPTDEFPSYETRHAKGSDAELVKKALVVRADVEAGRFREQAARYRLTAARNNLKPQVDLNLSLGYTGLAEGAGATRIDRGLERATGPSAGATVSLQWPWENSSALGAQHIAATAYDSASIHLRDLIEGIATNVPVAMATLQRSTAQGMEGVEAVRRYRTTLKNERTKRRLGTATVIDVINVEDRLNNALIAEVALRQEYANAIVQLLFELGELVRRDGDEYRVAIASLLSDRTSLE